MAVRRVELRLSDPGFEDVAKHLDELAMKLDKLKAKFDELSKKVITPRINLDGIAKADAELDKLNAKLDEISHKRVTATVGVRTDNNTLTRDLGKLASGGGGRGRGKNINSVDGLIKDILGGTSKAPIERPINANWFQTLLGRGFGLPGGGGGAAGAAGDAAGGAGSGAGGFLSFIGGANNSYTGILYGALAALAASIAPAVIPFGLGGAVGLGATGGAIAVGHKAYQQLQQLGQKLSGITGNTKSARQQRAAIQQQMAAIRSRNAGPLQVYGAASGLGHTAEGVFTQALTSPGPGFSGGPGGPGHPGSSFIQGLIPIFQQIGMFAKAIGPLLGDMFRMSLPFIKAFVTIMEQVAKAVFPVLLQSMKSFMPFIPQMVQGFVILAQGLAYFIKDLGPGMKDGMTVFKGLMVLAKGLLIGLAYAADYTAKFFANFGHVATDVARWVGNEWDKVVAFTKIAWPAVRHLIASVWDEIYQHTVGAVTKMVQWVINQDENFRHSVANIFDGIRHDLAHYWDVIWQYTVGSVQKGIGDVVRYFKGLPGSIMAALKGMGSTLWSWGKNLLQMIINGAKSMWSSVTGWFANLGKGILHAIGSLFHFGSPSKTMYQYGKWIVQGLHQGIQDHLAPLRGAASAMHGAILGGSPGAAQAYARRLAGAYGWAGQWGFINSVAMRESGWSMIAKNPTSPAYGIAQFINGPSEYYQYGGNPYSIAGQVTAFFNYIKQRYGSPAAAWQHELNYGNYDRGGILKQGYTLALNTSGHDEYVHTSASGGGNVYINVTGDFANPDATALRIVQAIRKYKQHHGNGPLGIA